MSRLDKIWGLCSASLIVLHVLVSTVIGLAIPAWYTLAISVMLLACVVAMIRCGRIKAEVIRDGEIVETLYGNQVYLKGLSGASRMSDDWELVQPYGDVDMRITR